MANPTFLFMNPASVVYTASAGSGWGNLNNYDTSTTWSAGTTASSYLQVDLGVAVNMTHIAVAGPSISDYSSNLVDIVGSNLADFSVNTQLHANIASELEGHSEVLIPLTTTGSFRYARIGFHDGVDDLMTVPVLGAFWIGNALVMDTPFDVPARFENAEYRTYEGVSLNGNLRTSQVYSGGRLVNEVRFSLQSDATANLTRSFFQSVKGRRYPFYFAEDTSASGDARLMHFADDYLPIETIRYNLNAVTMKMRTHESRF